MESTAGEVWTRLPRDVCRGGADVKKGTGGTKGDVASADVPTSGPRNGRLLVWAGCPHVVLSIAGPASFVSSHLQIAGGNNPPSLPLFAILAEARSFVSSVVIYSVWLALYFPSLMNLHGDREKSVRK